MYLDLRVIRYYVMNAIFCSVVLSLIQGIAHNTGVPP
jgi:hypothetical protein